MTTCNASFVSSVAGHFLRWCCNLAEMIGLVKFLYEIRLYVHSEKNWTWLSQKFYSFKPLKLVACQIKADRKFSIEFAKFEIKIFYIVKINKCQIDLLKLQYHHIWIHFFIAIQFENGIYTNLFLFEFGNKSFLFGILFLHRYCCVSMW